MEEVNLGPIKFPINYIILIIAFLVACGFVVYAIAPEYKESKLKKIETALIGKNIESKDLLYARIVKNEDNLIEDETYKKNVAKFDQMISGKNNFEDYLVNLVELSKNRNLIVGNFSISEVKPKKSNNKKVVQTDSNKANVTTGTISFEATGGYYSLYEYLIDIEKNIPLLNVDSVTVSAGKATAGEQTQNDAGSILNYSIKLSYYHY